VSQACHKPGDTLADNPVMSSFEDDTRVTPLGPVSDSVGSAAAFAGRVSPAWNFGANPNGKIEGVTGTLNFSGAANSKAVIARTLATWPDTTRFIAGGSSAGGYGAGLNFGVWAFLHYFGNAHYSYISWETIRDNLRDGWEWDRSM